MMDIWTELVIVCLLYMCFSLVGLLLLLGFITNEFTARVVLDFKKRKDLYHQL